MFRFAMVAALVLLGGCARTTHVVTSSCAVEDAAARSVQITTLEQRAEALCRGGEYHVVDIDEVDDGGFHEISWTVTCARR